MSKLKKHSPHQSEAEPSIISQVPKDKMGDFIQGLMDLRQQPTTAFNQWLFF